MNKILKCSRCDKEIDVSRNEGKHWNDDHRIFCTFECWTKFMNRLAEMEAS